MFFAAVSYRAKGKHKGVVKTYLYPNLETTTMSCFYFVLLELNLKKESTETNNYLCATNTCYH